MFLAAISYNWVPVAAVSPASSSDPKLSFYIRLPQVSEDLATIFFVLFCFHSLGMTSNMSGILNDFAYWSCDAWSEYRVSLQRACYGRSRLGSDGRSATFYTTLISLLTATLPFRASPRKSKSMVKMKRPFSLQPKTAFNFFKISLTSCRELPQLHSVNDVLGFPHCFHKVPKAFIWHWVHRFTTGHLHSELFSGFPVWTSLFPETLDWLYWNHILESCAV